MRFSNHRECPPSNPIQDRSRRRARFVNEVKAVIKASSNEAKMNLAALAQAMNKDKGTISRALNSDTNIELFTMFEFAEALTKEWKVTLVNREQDLNTIMPDVSGAGEHSKTSWIPLVPKSVREASISSEQGADFSARHTFKIGNADMVLADG